jgi:hypothetical protein
LFFGQLLGDFVNVLLLVEIFVILLTFFSSIIVLILIGLLTCDLFSLFVLTIEDVDGGEHGEDFVFVAFSLGDFITLEVEVH